MGERERERERESTGANETSRRCTVLSEKQSRGKKQTPYTHKKHMAPLLQTSLLSMSQTVFTDEEVIPMDENSSD
jgi:hypothetical protein